MFFLLLAVVVVSSKDAWYFNNGSGGASWKIGQPEVTLWNGMNTRSLPELRAFAFQLINCDRQLNRLAPLVEDALLAQAAQLHAEDMKSRRFYNHVTPDGKTPTDRLAAIGGRGSVGENIMLQSESVGPHLMLNWQLIEAFQESWMYSDGHRANLLTPQYTRVGYGIVADSATGRVYAVQKFQ